MGRTTFIRSLAVLAVLAPTLALAQASPATHRPYAPSSYGPQRDSWYIGFGIGSGVGSGVYGGQRFDFSDVYGLSSTPFSLQAEIGATVRPDLLLGFDLRLLRTQSSGSYVDGFGSLVSDPAVQVTQGLAMLTWFPARQGLYLRGGVGLASYSEDAVVNGVHSGGGSATGFSVLAGVGYAMWLGQTFNLSVGLDLSAQGYGDPVNLPSSTRYGELMVGFHWY
jgi:hypothetical protein